MPLRSEYPYTDALDDLESLIKKHVKDPSKQSELLDYLHECRKNKTVTFRYIHEELMKYRKQFSDYSQFTDNEREMIEDLFHFWG